MKKLYVLFALVMFVLPGCSGGGSSSDTASNSGATAKVLTTIAVSPNSSSVVVGAPMQFIATGTYSDSTTQDISTSVIWESSDGSIATISNDASSKGKATALAAGQTTITAVSGNIKGSTLLTVSVLNLLTDVSLGGYHHVGDGVWGTESVNSQFAYPTSGITYSESFALADQPQNFAYATITFIDRGIESSSGYRDTLMINSYAIPLPESNQDGSFTTFSSGKLPSNIFLGNQNNTITFQSGNVPWNLNDYDDFEFQNILIQFSN